MAGSCSPEVLNVKKFLAIALLLFVGQAVAGPVAPDGKTEVQVDYPAHQQFHNIGGTDGAGLCVFCSGEFMAGWQNVRQLKGWVQWMHKTHRGGGWPAKVDKMIAEYCATKNAPIPDYIQYEGSDVEVLDLALKTGRMAAVTYGPDHMVDLIHFDQNYGCFLDNNHPGKFIWMTRADAIRKMKAGGRKYWMWTLLAPPPPPVPHNGTRTSITPSELTPYSETEEMPAGYVWAPHDTDPGWVGLLKNGRQIGAYHYSNGIYRPIESDGSWGLPAQPPAPAPKRKEVTGCLRERLAAVERYTLSGREVSKDEAIKAITGKNLEDDTKKKRLTIIGTPDEVKMVLEDLKKPIFDGVRDSVLVQDYQPSDWAVAEAGFFVMGSPTIYLQAANGKVEHRQDVYYGPAALVSLIRKPDPNYDPKKDPDLATSPMPKFPEIDKDTGSVIGTLLSLLGVTAYAARRREDA